MDTREQQNLPPSWAEAIMQQLTQNQQANSENMIAQAERILRLEELLTQQHTHEPTTEPVQEPTTEPVENPTETPPVRTDPLRRPRSRLPDPVLFAGNAHDWPTWRITMENKLAVDGEAIGDAQDQFVYVFSRLEKLAWKNTGTFVKQRRHEGDPDELLNYLEQIYGDPNAQARAARRLHHTR
jgi:hypothetical protein